MSKFEAALAALLASNPTGVVFDLSGTEFISAAGYDAIGCCSREIARVVVHSRNDIAEKVLRLLGYDGVVFERAVHSSLNHDGTSDDRPGVENKGGIFR